MSVAYTAEAIDTAFRTFVADPRFPCLAGKGVVRAEGYERGVYGELGSQASAVALGADLAAFARADAGNDSRLRAFVAVFPESRFDDEVSFERALWTQLQRLSELSTDTAWDPKVSDDPEDPHFSFSFGGRAMFIVGLHPASSRLARQFQWPTLVFNPRSQFERLRETGRFERLRGVVREREIALQGTLNPNLADFGEQSEARQYSGRATEAEWRCPFHHRTT